MGENAIGRVLCTISMRMCAMRATVVMLCAVGVAGGPVIPVAVPVASDDMCDVSGSYVCAVCGVLRAGAA